MFNEFEQAEQAGIQSVVSRMIEEKMESEAPLLTRIEDLENIQLEVVEPLIPLVVGDNLETVKARVNEILLILNQAVPI